MEQKKVYEYWRGFNNFYCEGDCVTGPEGRKQPVLVVITVLGASAGAFISATMVGF